MRTPQAKVAIDLGDPVPTVATSRSGPAVGKAQVWRYRDDTTVSGPSLPAEWGDPAAPLVYVSFGSVAGLLGRFDALYPAILEALADLPMRVLITTGEEFDPARLDPLPANAWAMQWWPQAAVMREAALQIGHGGFGTTMMAVVTGLLQLVLPLFSSDQFMNAERIQAVGIGTQLVGGLDAVPRFPVLCGTSSTSRATPRLPAVSPPTCPDVSATVAVLPASSVNPSEHFAPSVEVHPFKSGGGVSPVCS